MTGDAAAVWVDNRIQAAVFDLSDPEVRSVSIPATARAGLPVSFAASASDAWSALTSVSWNFGDGSGAAGASVAHSFKKPGQFDITVTATDPLGHATRTSSRLAITPALALSNRVIRVKGGKARLRLVCPGIAECRGGARLARRGKVKKLVESTRD